MEFEDLSPAPDPVNILSIFPTAYGARIGRSQFSISQMRLETPGKPHSLCNALPIYSNENALANDRGSTLMSKRHQSFAQVCTKLGVLRRVAHTPFHFNTFSPEHQRCPNWWGRRQIVGGDRQTSVHNRAPIESGQKFLLHVRITLRELTTSLQPRRSPGVPTAESVQ